MAVLKARMRLVENLNDQFINVGMAKTKSAYERFYEKISIRINNLARGRKISSRDVKKAITGITIDTKESDRQAHVMLTLSAMTSIIATPKLDKEDQIALAPVIVIAALIDLRSTKKTALKINRLTTAVLTRKTKNLHGNDKKIAESLKKYYNDNKKGIEKLVKSNRVTLAEVNKRVKNNVSKAIFKDFKKEITRKVEMTQIVDGKKKIVKRFQSLSEIQKNLSKKYAKQERYRINRIVDTEVHRLAEETKQAHHLLLGYSKKKWITAGDGRVRDSHRSINGTVVSIDNNFRVGGSWGMYPGDPKMKPKEIINCRCTSVYIKEK